MHSQAHRDGHMMIGPSHSRPNILWLCQVKVAHELTYTGRWMNAQMDKGRGAGLTRGGGGGASTAHPQQNLQ